MGHYLAKPRPIYPVCAAFGFTGEWFLTAVVASRGPLQDEGYGVHPIGGLLQCAVDGVGQTNGLRRGRVSPLSRFLCVEPKC